MIHRRHRDSVASIITTSPTGGSTTAPTIRRTRLINLWADSDFFQGPTSHRPGRVPSSALSARPSSAASTSTPLSMDLSPFSGDEDYTFPARAALQSLHRAIGAQSDNVKLDIIDTDTVTKEPYDSVPAYALQSILRALLDNLQKHATISIRIPPLADVHFTGFRYLHLQWLSQPARRSTAPWPFMSLLRYISSHLYSAPAPPPLLHSSQTLSSQSPN
ncbi:hypothetical protein C8R44DRAFT_753661 [Mycena epipterygia]|nr:hypothetical protein C8R44DRAFT_753661 [Mycena epipterygia]